MLFNLIRSGFSTESVIIVLLSIPAIIFALSIHELSHGFVAHLMGDNTARNMGRLTLNPKKHLDVIGTIMMFTVGFGWAKPVPVNSRNFRKPKSGLILTSIAGPLSNLIFSYIFFVLSMVVVKLNIASITSSIYATPTFRDNMIQALYLLFYVAMQLNLTLAVFNLLPIPPLDGSRILFAILPPRASIKVMQYQNYISIGIMILLFTGILTYPLSYICDKIIYLYGLSIVWLV